MVKVLGTRLSAGINAKISGIIGMGYVLRGVRIVLLLLQIKGSILCADRSFF
nr:hypothetical protein [uncultured Mogibacterium sp.]